MASTNLTTRRKNLQRMGNQLAALLENQDCPHLVAEGIKEFFCEIGSVVPLWHPKIVAAVFPTLIECAESQGIKLGEPNYVGQEIAANPQDYISAEALTN